MRAFLGVFFPLLTIVSCSMRVENSPMSFRITDIRGIPIEGVSVAPPTWSSVPQISNSNGIIRVSERFVILVKDGYLERLVDAETVGESVVLTKESNARSADERASYVGELNERKRELKVAAYY